MSDLKNIESAVTNATHLVRASWQQHVMGAALLPGVKEVTVNINLRRIYSDSIVFGDKLNMPGSGRFSGNIVATRRIAFDLEFGKGPWDMKPMLLGGKNVRISRGVRYNTVPFRHRTPGAATRDQHFSGVMPKDIYKRAKALTVGQRLYGTGKDYPAKSNATTGYQHKSNFYEGMKRHVGPDQKSHFSTMRRVSDNSDPDSWIHPGYEPHNIASGVANYCRPIVEEMIRDAAIADMVNVSSLSAGIHIEVK